MELILTGDMMSAQEAKAFGLVSKVVETDRLLDEAQTMGEKIAGNWLIVWIWKLMVGYSKLIVGLAKDAVK